MREECMARGPRWVVDAPPNVAEFFLSLPLLLLPGSTLVLEECAMVAEIRAAILEHTVEPSLRIARQTLFPRSRQHHLAVSPESTRVLATGAEQYGPAAPQLCDHLSAYCATTVVLEWHDAFCENPMLLSHELPEIKVRAFAEYLGVGAQQCAD